MKVRRDDLPRDLKVLRYLDALNAGELETAMILWEEASQDPELERMLIELDGALFAEVSGGDQTAKRRPRARRSPESPANPSCTRTGPVRGATQGYRECGDRRVSGRGPADV